MHLTRDHPARRDERRRLQADYARQVEVQWRRYAGAAGLKAARTHFDGLKITSGGGEGADQGSETGERRTATVTREKRRY